MNVIGFINTYKNNCFWFFIPPLLFNIIIVKYLPEYYLKNINHPIIIWENILRFITIAFSAIMAITINNKIGKIGFIVYIIVIIIYFCSYFIVIKFPASSFNNNLIILLAPAWTSVLWLIGIGLIGNKIFVNIPYHFSVYCLLSISFAIIHSIHFYYVIRS